MRRLARKDALLGEDVQYTFVDKEDIEKTKEFFEKQQADVTILDSEKLKKLELMQMLASKCFSDIASTSKINNLFFSQKM